MQLHSYREAHVVSTQTANEIVKDKRTSNLANQNRLMDFTPTSRPAKFLPEKTKTNFLPCRRLLHDNKAISHLKNWGFSRKTGRQALHFGFFRRIIDCNAADQRFCKYDYREKAAMFVYWNYRDEGSVSERSQYQNTCVYRFKKNQTNAKARLRY